MAVKRPSEFSAAPSTLRTSVIWRLPGRRSTSSTSSGCSSSSSPSQDTRRRRRSANARLELTRLAFEGVPGVDVELDPHARTVDSLEARRPRDAFFIIGGDQFVDFWQWKRPERVLELARLGVAMRPGVPDDRVREAHARLPAPDRISYFSLEPVPVSSSLVRERIASGGSIDDLVPEKVAAAIRRLGLYAPAE